MSPSADTPYLITMATHPEHNAVTRFSDACGRLEVTDLVAGYDELVATAPRRHHAGRMYLVGHDGRPSTGSHTNRIEEHLAMALFNDHPHWELPTRASVDLIDYQVPLKAHRSDVGIGKIDIFGLTGDEVPVVVELKVLGRNRADTPLRALLEALSYAAIVEANASAIGEEVVAATDRVTTSGRPDLLIAAPDDYWEYWSHKTAAGGWIESIRILALELSRTLGVDIGFLSLGVPELELGIEGAHPHIASGFRAEEFAWWPGRLIRQQ